MQREKIAWILDVVVHNGPRKSGDGGPCGHLAFSLFIVAEERGGLRPERPSLSSRPAWLAMGFLGMRFNKRKLCNSGVKPCLAYQCGDEQSTCPLLNMPGLGYRALRKSRS